MYKAVISDQLSHFPSDIRWVIVDTETEEILDDAQGYGYRSSDKAYWGFRYSSSSPEAKEKIKEKYRILKKWCQENRPFVGLLDTMYFEMTSGSWAKNKKFDAAFVEKMLKENGYTDLPFSAKELFQHWKRKREL